MRVRTSCISMARRRLSFLIKDIAGHRRNVAKTDRRHEFEKKA
jgi:hypothetical protein